MEPDEDDRQNRVEAAVWRPDLAAKQCRLEIWVEIPKQMATGSFCARNAGWAEQCQTWSNQISLIYSGVLYMYK